ncbi:30S ribosomal protein S27ae [[Eubacterium] cellulosolvens]
MSEERKTPKQKARISGLYEYKFETGEIKMRNKKCPRCGSIMAKHEVPINRWACGACNYTEFVTSTNG